MPVKYCIPHTNKPVWIASGWESPEWKNIKSIEVANFRPESSDHRPVTKVKLQYDDDGIYGLFFVKDRYVRCIRTSFQDHVYKDSCVEFFVQPDQGKGYFNFEFNCGGALLSTYITYSITPEGKVEKNETLPFQEEDRGMIRIYHSLPRIVEPEIQEETEWQLGFFIPFSLFKKYIGKARHNPGEKWRANFYKCGDETSHPHWASWSPVDELNFHMPQCFGTIEFGPY